MLASHPLPPAGGVRHKALSHLLLSLSLSGLTGETLQVQTTLTLKISRAKGLANP